MDRGVECWANLLRFGGLVAAWGIIAFPEAAAAARVGPSRLESTRLVLCTTSVDACMVILVFVRSYAGKKLLNNSLSMRIERHSTAGMAGAVIDMLILSRCNVRECLQRGLGWRCC